MSRVVAALAVFGVVVLGVALQASRPTPPGLLVVAVPERFEASRLPPSGPRLAASQVPLPFEVGRGETVGGVLGSLGMPPGEIGDAVEALSAHVDLRRIRAGEDGLAYYDATNALARLELDVAGRGTVALARRDGSWTSSFRAAVRRVLPVRVEGRLETFLTAAVADAGADPTLAYAMSDVLQWDLDFNRDLQRGDRFRVLYEDVTLDGEPAGVGRILALAYETGGRVYEAYAWGEDGGYYDGEGRPLQKMFLRSPLPFTRVTSRFSNRRFHPVLKVYRPHYGVDYGAPTGTPVRATAGGTVTFAARSGGSGNLVKVRHPNGYLTAYLHLSRFASGVRVGARVRQGDVVGYVGATGLATAPHLDYRVQLDGRWIDPLSIKSVAAEPIAASQRGEFGRQRDRLRAALAGEAPPFVPPPVSSVRVASTGASNAASPAVAR